MMINYDAQDFASQGHGMQKKKSRGLKLEVKPRAGGLDFLWRIREVKAKGVLISWLWECCN